MEQLKPNIEKLVDQDKQPQPEHVTNGLAFAALSHFAEHPESMPASVFRALGVGLEHGVSITDAQRLDATIQIKKAVKVLDKELPEEINQQITVPPKRPRPTLPQSDVA